MNFKTQSTSRAKGAGRSRTPGGRPYIHVRCAPHDEEPKLHPHTQRAHTVFACVVASGARTISEDVLYLAHNLNPPTPRYICTDEAGEHIHADGSVQGYRAAGLLRVAIPSNDVLARTARSTPPFSILFLVPHAGSWISTEMCCQRRLTPKKGLRNRDVRYRTNRPIPCDPTGS